MPEIAGACPCGDVCAVCHPAYQAGGAVSLAPSPAAGGVVIGAGDAYARQSFYSCESVYPTFNTWTRYPFAQEVPEVAMSQAQQREAAREAERQQEAYARMCAEQERLRTEARHRAEGMLLRWLSPEQARDYREHQRFDVTGSDGSRWRILCQGQTGNVQLLDNRGNWTYLYCAHPRGLPDPAAWLAQAMAVAHDAAGFIRVANVYSTAVRTLAGDAPEPEPPPGGWRLFTALQGIRPSWRG